MMGDAFYRAIRAKEMPSLTTPPRDWTAIAWSDVTKPDVARWTAVLPLAATEQHGPHLPLRTDVLIAEAYLARVREMLPETVPATFLPVEEIGISTEHTDYPGTLTLAPEEALRNWTAIGERVARHIERALAGTQSGLRQGETLPDPMRAARHQIVHQVVVARH